jgi:SAM-dependent methyltransferase
MLTFSCRLCKCERYEIIAASDQIRFKCFGHKKQIVKCTRCELVQLFPFWNSKELDFLYNGYSLKSDFSGQKKTKNVNKYVEKYVKRHDRILEIGAGGGDDLFYLKNKGYNIVGIDKDPSVCDGVNILNFSVDNLCDREFDFIYGIHLLEHIEDPSAFISEVHRLLASGGKFLFEIPNVDDPLLSLYHSKAYNAFYWYPFHLFCYSSGTIAKLFSQASSLFEIQILLKQRYGVFNHLRWLLFKKPGNFNPKVPVVDHIYEYILKRKNVSDTLIVVGQKKF